MTKCKLCKGEIEGVSLMCSKGQLCNRCSHDIMDAEFQPIMKHNDILWTIAEVFTLRAQGKEVSFRELWIKNDNIFIDPDKLIQEWVGEKDENDRKN